LVLWETKTNTGLPPESPTLSQVIKESSEDAELAKKKIEV
jgi:hypothetical protein